MLCLNFPKKGMQLFITLHILKSISTSKFLKTDNKNYKTATNQHFQSTSNPKINHNYPPPFKNSDTRKNASALQCRLALRAQSAKIGKPRKKIRSRLRKKAIRQIVLPRLRVAFASLSSSHPSSQVQYQSVKKISVFTFVRPRRCHKIVA